LAKNSQRYLQKLVALAREHTGTDRQALLTTICGNDDELKARIEAMIELSENEAESLEDVNRGSNEGSGEDLAFNSIDNSADAKQEIESAEGDRFTAGSIVGGRYEIVRLLGKGGMGEVYLATDLRISRSVALKVLHRDLVSKKENFQRFALEAQTASALNHPHIMTVYEVDSTPDHSLFIVAEYIEGRPLSALIRDRISTEKALEIAIQISSALSAAHRAGIVHRDVKPENVMVRFDGYVKVLDFGLAKLIQANTVSVDSGSEDPTIPIVHTKPGMVMGTAAYMSPEQARGLAVDARTDIWGLGAVLYEMLSGRRPFWGETAADTMVSVLRNEPKPIFNDPDRSFLELEAVVRRALAKNVAARYQSMDEFRADLEVLKTKLQISSTFGDSYAGRISTSLANRKSTSAGAATNPEDIHAARHTQAVQRPSGFPDPTAEITNADRGVGNFRVAAARTALLILIGISLAAAAFYIASFSRGRTEIDSIAVLPFENLTGDPSLNFLSDGISEGLIDRLSELPQLKVISRNSSFKFRGPEMDLQSIGSKLGVRAIVTGTIAQVGDELDIRYEIVDPADSRHLAGGKLRRKLGNIVDIQRDIAESAASSLKLKLTDSQSKRFHLSNTEDSEAYRYYLNGLVELNGPEDVRGKALQYFERAAELDPSFADAYAEIAWIYMSRANGSGNPGSLVPRAREATDRALSLDPASAKAHVVKAMLYEYDFDWQNAENEYRRAVELSPNLDFARNNYAFFLSSMGRHDEALSQLEQQRLRDPINERLGILQKGIVLTQARRFEEALEAYRAAQAVEPSREIPHFSLGYLYAGKGMYTEAAKHFEISVERLGGYNEYSQSLIYLAAVYARIPSRQARAREILANVERSATYASPAVMAAAYSALGDNDKAMDLLEQAYALHDPLLKYIGIGHEYDGLRKDPKFSALLQRVGLR